MKYSEETICIVHMIRLLSMMPTIHRKELLAMYMTSVYVQHMEAKEYTMSDDEILEEFIKRVERLEKEETYYEQ